MCLITTESAKSATKHIGSRKKTHGIVLKETEATIPNHEHNSRQIWHMYFQVYIILCFHLTIIQWFLAYATSHKYDYNNVHALLFTWDLFC